MLFASIFSVLCEKGLSSRLENRVLAFCVNHSYRGVTQLLFNFGEARMIFLLRALNMISNASSAVVYNTLFFFLSLNSLDFQFRI